MPPDLASKNRNKARVKDDFPAPVRPITPTLSLRSTLKVRFFKTGGRSGAYPTVRFSTSIRPWVGQAAGGLLPSSDSVGSSVY